MTRPRGSPPMPSAMSRPNEPVDTTSTSITASREPNFMIEPLPKARSIWPSAASNARCLSIVPLSKRRNTGWFISPLRYHTAATAAQTRSGGKRTWFVLRTQGELLAGRSWACRIKAQEADIDGSGPRGRETSSEGGHAFIHSIERIEDVTRTRQQGYRGPLGRRVLG